MILRVASMGTKADELQVVKKKKEVWRARERTEGELNIWEMMCEDKLFGESPQI